MRSLCNFTPYFNFLTTQLACCRALREAHAQFQASLSTAESDFQSLGELDKRIKSFNVGPNPYTWFTMEALEDTWRNLQKIIKERDVDLNKELERQEENDKLRKEFAKIANAFHAWLTETRFAFTITFLLPWRYFFCSHGDELFLFRNQVQVARVGRVIMIVFGSEIDVRF
jgi:hypothetical protein